MNNNKYIDILINELNSKYGNVLNVINKNITDSFPNEYYRVRLVDKQEKISNINQLSYPKHNVSFGRCNFVNEPVFYCSDRASTAIAETFKYQNLTNKYLYLSVWKFKPGKEINIFPLLHNAKQKGLISKVNSLSVIQCAEKRIIAKKQLLELEKHFYDDDTSISAAISNILFYRNLFPCDSIFYPSAIKNETGINISIKTDYFDRNVDFKRAHLLEVSSQKNSYKVLPLKYTLSSKDEIIWRDSNLDEIIFRTLLYKDLDL